MNIELTEYQRGATPRTLDVEERDALAAGIPRLEIAPAHGEEGKYHLTPGAVVGAFQIGDLSVTIRPKGGYPEADLSGVLLDGGI